MFPLALLRAAYRQFGFVSTVSFCISKQWPTASASQPTAIFEHAGERVVAFETVVGDDARQISIKNRKCCVRLQRILHGQRHNFNRDRWRCDKEMPLPVIVTTNYRTIYVYLASSQCSFIDRFLRAENEKIG